MDTIPITIYTCMGSQVCNYRYLIQAIIVRTKSIFKTATYILILIINFFFLLSALYFSVSFLNHVTLEFNFYLSLISHHTVLQLYVKYILLRTILFFIFLLSHHSIHYLYLTFYSFQNKFYVHQTFFLTDE